MIQKETIVINDAEFEHTYSDENFYIERNSVKYEEAIDPIDSGREYTETNIKVEKIIE